MIIAAMRRLRFGTRRLAMTMLSSIDVDIATVVMRKPNAPDPVESEPR
jgi:hypothetical protein